MNFFPCKFELSHNNEVCSGSDRGDICSEPYSKYESPPEDIGSWNSLSFKKGNDRNHRNSHRDIINNCCENRCSPEESNGCEYDITLYPSLNKCCDITEYSCCFESSNEDEKRRKKEKYREFELFKIFLWVIMWSNQEENTGSSEKCNNTCWEMKLMMKEK